jgi:hypothetical protein
MVLNKRLDVLKVICIVQAAGSGLGFGVATRKLCYKAKVM